MYCKKNRNLFRRLINRIPLTAFCFLLSAFCLFSSCDKEENLHRSWNLQGVYINGEPIKEAEEYHLKLNYTYYVFVIGDRLNIRTIVDGITRETPNGFYHYYYKEDKIKLEFTLVDQRSEITAIVKKLTSSELQLEYEKDGNIYLLKLYAR